MSAPHPYLLVVAGATRAAAVIGKVAMSSGMQPRLVELVQRTARGQQDAFAELYAETSARIRSTTLRVLRSPDQAAEVTQEVYADVWQQAARYSPDRGSVLAWMTTMARRRAIDRVRSVTRAAARDQWYSREGLEPAYDYVWSGVEQRMDADRVRRALATLTAIQRESLVLAYYGGYSQTQIANLLDVPLGTVKTRMRNGMVRLRQAWDAPAVDV